MNHLARAACILAPAALISLLWPRQAISAEAMTAGSLSPQVIRRIDDAAAEVPEKTGVPDLFHDLVR